MCRIDPPGTRRWSGSEGCPSQCSFAWRQYPLQIACAGQICTRHRTRAGSGDPMTHELTLDLIILSAQQCHIVWAS